MRGVDAMMSYDTWKQLAATASVKLVQDGMVVGLGTGSTAAFMIHALAQRIQEGLRIVGAVASSQASQDLAAQLSIPLTDLETHPELDLYIDG
ncbi:MAG: ribose-5-phosphate isomerase A, partial [Ktedonobacteraceae bacterium]|nr:ribose-5-phosphate isomerase A [Ktedonobacteraceae bacterium]